MVSKVVAGIIIFLSINLLWFASIRFVADMQMNVANRAFSNYDINTAQVYLMRALKTNPTEFIYRKNLKIVKAKRNQLEKLAKQQTKKP